MQRVKTAKTNAMRILEQAGIPYAAHEYDGSHGAVDGLAVARQTGQDPARVFKTLVTHGADQIFVFCIPVAAELDLKAAARAAGQKNIEMLPLSQITQVTGYVRGGCSPLGMKKRYPVFLDERAKDWGTILVSGGKIGLQIELAPEQLALATGGQFCSCARVGP